MAQRVRDVMTTNPVTIDSTATAAEAAALMLRHDIGDVLVMRDARLLGIVTDRDIVVRCVAHDVNPEEKPVGEICSATDLATLSPDDSAERAVQVMRDRKVRRVPVLEAGQPVGVVSIGDLAIEREPDSALGHISAARPNA